MFLGDRRAKEATARKAQDVRIGHDTCFLEPRFERSRSNRLNGLFVTYDRVIVSTIVISANELFHKMYQCYFYEEIGIRVKNLLFDRYFFLSPLLPPPLYKRV